MNIQNTTDECAETLSRVAGSAMKKMDDTYDTDSECCRAPLSIGEKKVVVVDDTSEAIKKIAKEVSEKAPYKVMLTPLGERMIYKTEAGDYTAPLSIMGYPDKPLNVSLHDMMCTLYTAAQQIIETKRAVPLTRNEFIATTDKGGCTKFGYTKGDLQKLEKKKLIKIGHTYLANKTTKKSVGARVVVYPTPLGRGYIREHIDKEFLSGGEVQ